MTALRHGTHLWTRLRREGSEGSKGSKGSEGGGGGFAADLRKGARLTPQVVSKGVFASAQGATAAPPLRVADCPGQCLQSQRYGFTFLCHMV